jgi:hypothetical protein
MPAKLIILLPLFSSLTAVLKHEIEQTTLQNGEDFGRALSAGDGHASHTFSVLLS